MAKRRRATVVTVLVMALFLGCGAWLLFGNAPSPSIAPVPVAAPSSAPPGTPDDAIAADFVARWSRGDLTGAGKDTNAPNTATAQLRQLDQQLPVTHIDATIAGAGTGNGVGIQVTVSLRGLPDWTYQSSLPIVASGGHSLVDWAPTDINPSLTYGYKFALGKASPDGAIAFADRHGQAITAAAHPALAGLLGDLTSEARTLKGGTPGTNVELVDAATGAPAMTLATLVPPKAVPLKLTIDLSVQQAAENAVASAPSGTGVVVEQPSTGDILAIANNPENGYDTALLAKLAPGSAMKVVTSAVLLGGGVSQDTKVPCTSTATVDGYTFHNEDGLARSDTTLADDFALSCNTAFIGLRDDVPGAALHDEAAEVFGLGEPWDIGTGDPTPYGEVPIPAANDPVTQAADLIGQGDVTMSPLAMTSIAATVESDSFHQPVVLTGTSGYHTARSLPSGVDASLRSMMRLVVTDGTAEPALGSLPGYVGAKTGSAQVNGQDANGWLIAFDGDLAVGCVAQAGGSGVGAAGPVVTSILSEVAAH
jgi:hypothetical protein